MLQDFFKCKKQKMKKKRKNAKNLKKSRKFLEKNLDIKKMLKTPKTQKIQINVKNTVWTLLQHL